MKRALILATTNPKKIERLSWIFAPYFEDLQPQDVSLTVQEDGEKLSGDDAAMKAVIASQRYNCPAVATETAHNKETIALANNGKLLFAEELENDGQQWDQAKRMFDWFLQPR